MIAYISRDPIGDDVSNILEYMRLSTCDRIGTHELHAEFNIPPGEFTHGDGWGIIWEEDRVFHEERRLEPYWECPPDEDFIEKLKGSHVIIVHARKKSPGKILTLESVHPFVNRENGTYSALVHNGTVPLESLRPPRKHTPLSPDSDTERMFYNFIEEINGQADVVSTLRDLVSSFGANFSANYHFIHGGKLYSSVNYAGESARPIYLGMKYLIEPSRVVIASEQPPTIPGNWKSMQNGTILETDLRSLSTTLH